MHGRGRREVIAVRGTGQSAIAQGWHFSTLQPATESHAVQGHSKVPANLHSPPWGP